MNLDTSVIYKPAGEMKKFENGNIELT